MELIRPKKTLYNGILFRSKLEAKWAVFFDTLCIAFKYEPVWDEVDIGIGYVQYKPDFYLPDIDLWIEVKPVGFRNMKYGDKKKAEGWVEDYNGLLVLVGPPSMPKNTTEAHYHLTWNERKKVFYLNDHMWWCECPKCGRINIQPDGGIPTDCTKSCYPEPSYDLFGDELPEPTGHKSSRLKNAYRLAHNFEF